ncbi:9062_t:CDS:1, partial [Ambispora leptoticha]
QSTLPDDYLNTKISRSKIDKNSTKAIENSSSDYNKKERAIKLTDSKLRKQQRKTCTKEATQEKQNFAKKLLEKRGYWSDPERRSSIVTQTRKQTNTSRIGQNKVKAYVQSKNNNNKVTCKEQIELSIEPSRKLD